METIYGGMPAIARLLEDIGRSIQPGVTRQTEDPVSGQQWDCLSLISVEVIGLCTLYVSQRKYHFSPQKND